MPYRCTLQGIASVVLAVWLAIVPVAAGQMTLLGVGGAGGASTPFSITNTATNSSTVSGTSFSFATQSVGAADPTRIIVVAVGAHLNNAGNVISQLQICGSNATQVTSATQATTPGTFTDIWYLAVSAGTTCTIAITASNTGFSRAYIAVYSVIGTGASIVATGTGTLANATATSLSTSASIPVGGGAISIVNVHSATAGSFTPTNLTTDNTTVVSGDTDTAGHNSSSSGSTAMGWSWTASTDAALSIATINP